MRRLFLIFLCIYINHACERKPTIYQSRVDKSKGDAGFQLKINENPTYYIPGNVYTMYLMSSNPFDTAQRFTRFTITVESTNETGMISPQKVGSFQLFNNDFVTFNFDCINTLHETNSSSKSDVFFMWTAPESGSGCVTFKAMVYKDNLHWYADEDNLVRTLCEQTDKDKFGDPDECCSCDEAKYSMVFEGIWSKETHPKDYPTLLWLTHFSDVIGASHEKNFTFWGEGQIASEGFRSLAEWGSVRLMETELRAKSKYLRSIIKAQGLWHPHVNENTTTSFKVDRRHPFISLASMFGPTPDWVVGVNGLNLCLKDCTWKENLALDLFPYDAGTDSGITYMSPNTETKPRERMFRITTTYPEDPRAPFYDPSKKEMTALARLYLKRDSVIKRNCDEKFLSAQLDVSENTEDTSRAECAVTDYSNWSECSVSCGKGLRMRTREYRIPQKAQMFNCNRQLVSKEMCVAAVPECEGGQPEDDNTSIGEIEEPLDAGTGICETSPWGPWNECSVSCGVGVKMRVRHFVDKMGMKKCPHVQAVEKEKCMMPACGAEQQEDKDPMCPTTDWSDWSPCSASCGKGVKLRTRLLLVQPELQQKCSQRIEMVQQKPCIDTPDCKFDMATAKVVCMQGSEAGPCTGYFNRWFFDVNELRCKPFIYGGCRGNKNNFLTHDECREACQIVRDGLSGNPQPQPLTRASFEPVFLPTFVSNFDTDCMVTKWSPWSQCSTSCGPGITESIRIIKKHADYGGKPCPGTLLRRRQCMGPPCN